MLKKLQIETQRLNGFVRSWRNIRGVAVNRSPYSGWAACGAAHWENFAKNSGALLGMNPSHYIHLVNIHYAPRRFQYFHPHGYAVHFWATEPQAFINNFE